jgi:ABC-2 type transport system permease protein
MLRSEIRKLVTVRTPAGLIVAAVVVAAVGAFSTTSSLDSESFRGGLRDQEFFLLSSINLAIFAALMGVRAVTDEFAHGTIVWTALIDNRRGRQLVAKAVAAAAASAAMTTLGITAASFTATAVARGKAGDVAVEAGDAAAIAGLVAATACWGVIGVAVGVMLRRPVAAVVAVLMWMLAIENLGAGVLGDAAKFLPGQAAHAFAAVGAADRLSPAVTGAVVTIAYTGVALVVAVVLAERRPVEVGS